MSLFIQPLKKVGVLGSPHSPGPTSTKKDRSSYAPAPGIVDEVGRD
jgi:hypothetical protein